MQGPAAIVSRPTPRALLLLVTAGVCLAARPARAREGAPLSLAIVVGSNRAPTTQQDNLRFGDDDAIRSANTMELLGIQATLLVSPDDETRELYPSLRPTGPATRAAMKAAFEAVAVRIAAAHAAGRETRLYFFFAGHGDLADGRPFLQLDEGRLWREDLAAFLRGAAADDNHVLVDACHAATFVAGRGPGGERAPLAPGFSRQAGDVWPARIGFLTARSSGEQTHEWAEFQAGIFSHELRSGLAGAADANLDGKVTYREIAAFVNRANEAIPNRRYRPEVSTAPPDADLDTVLADLPGGAEVMTLEVDVRPPGHTFVETARGVRLCDLHPGAGPAVRLRLPVEEGPLFVEQVGASDGVTREYSLHPQAGRIRLSALTPAERRVRARGAAHEAFMLLFQRPFDDAVVAAYRPDDADDVAPPPSAAARRRHRIGKTTAGLGIVAIAVGAGCAGTARLIKSSDSQADSQVTTMNRNAWIRGLDIAGWSLIGAGAAAVTTGVALLLWPDKQPPQVTATALREGGAVFGYQLRF
ncbi:MAG TPA: hypothetical protein VMU50_22810 [Polyangia bacterium]|nr:hypothetical protein [Polyangia bacterium]